MTAIVPRRAFVIALLGAESSGKSTLASALAAALEHPADADDTADTDAVSVGLVSEYLREFCDRHGRTPRIDEQRGIAEEQTRRIDAAACAHAVVVADTTALMTAVYSDQVFGDTGLYDLAQKAHAGCDLTLLTGLDLAWQADGLQRDGPQVREPVDDKIRAALDRAGFGYVVIAGIGAARAQVALGAVRKAMATRCLVIPPESGNTPLEQPRWQWHCERCGDAECERRPLLPR